MVATIRPISDAKGTGVYFYLVENNFETSRSWVQNKASQSLGLKELTRQDLENILKGQLSKDVVLGKKTEKGLEHMPGHEVVFSAPKSVSIMGLVAKDERLMQAHEKAVDVALSFMQRESLQTRIQENGKKRLENTGNSLIAKFTHFTSRPPDENTMPDPQIHTHCLVANATLCDDNKWRSIESAKLYEHTMLLGEIYRMELGREVEKLGYGIDKFTDEKSGRQTFEIEGVSKDAIFEFSQRRHDILEAADELGRHDPKALDFLARLTRAEKSQYSNTELEKGWTSRTDSKRLSHNKEGAFKNESFKKEREERVFTQASKNARAHLTEREAVFKKESLYQSIYAASHGTISLEELEKTIGNDLQDGRLRMTKTENSYTTPGTIRLEKELLALLKNSHNKVSPIETQTHIKELLQNTHLTKGQKEAIGLVLSTKDRVVGIQGAAGTGKTTALKELKTLLGDKGMHLIGVAPSKEASRVLKDEAGLHAETLQALLLRNAGFIKDRGTSKAVSQMKEAYKNTVLVCDESSLSGNRQMTKLLKLSQAFDLRLVLLGDKKQLSGVEAGKPFHLMQNNGLKTATMTDILRQKNKELKQAVQESQKAVDKTYFYSKAHIKKAFGFLKEDNIREIKGSLQDGLPSFTSNEELAEGAYKVWKEFKEKGKDAFLVAPSHDLRSHINRRVRQDLIKGKSQAHDILIGKNLTKAELSYDKNYKKGDIVIFHRDLKELKLKKDEIYSVEKSKDGKIHLLTTKGESRVFSPKDSKGTQNLFTKETLPLSKGERIRFTRNSSLHPFITNGAGAEVLSLTKDKVCLKTESHGLQSLPRQDNDFKHIDHAYSMTAFASQGKTVNTVIGILRSKEAHLELSHQRSFYVSLSRARHNAFIVTDNKERLIKSLSEKTGAKSSALEMVKSESKVQEKTLPKETSKSQQIEIKQEKHITPSKGGFSMEM